MAKPAPETVPNPPARKVGLALGSGSARGLALIGVLRAIEEAGIKVDLVAGTSMGAVLGAVYAARRMAGLADRFRTFDWRHMAGLLDPVLPRSGLIDGQEIADFVRTHVAAANIEDLPISFRAGATCIMNGEEVVCASGDLIDAVRASISVPGIFTPMRSNGRILVDRGLVNAVDLNHDIVTRRAPMPPADTVPAERPHPHAPARRPAQTPRPGPVRSLAARGAEPLPDIFDVLLSSIYIMQARMTQASLRHDRLAILIRPPLGAVRFMEFDRAEEIIEIGYRSSAEQLAHWGRSAH